MKVLLLITLLTTACGVCAADVYPTLEIGGKIYTNCTVKPRNPVEAFILFDGGGAKVKIEELPIGVQRSLNYSPEAAKEYLDDQARKKREAAERAENLAHDASERWKQLHCRLVNGSMVKLTEMERFSGKVVGFKSGSPIIQTYKTNDTFENYYVPASGNGAEGAYIAPGSAGWRKHVVSSEVVPNRKYIVKHYPDSQVALDETISVIASKLPAVTNGIAILDCGESYVPH